MDIQQAKQLMLSDWRNRCHGRAGELFCPICGELRQSWTMHAHLTSHAEIDPVEEVTGIAWRDEEDL